MTKLKSNGWISVPMLIFFSFFISASTNAATSPSNTKDTEKKLPMVQNVVNPTVLVLPFKISSSPDRTYDWAGRSFSYFLTEGLRLNNFQVFSDADTANLLEAHHIVYPYAISRATILQLAKEKNLPMILWGEINISKGKEKDAGVSLLVQPVVFYTQPYKQLKFAAFKGEMEHLSQLMSHVLKQILNDIAASASTGSQTQNVTVNIPHFRWYTSNFDVFIKTLLLKDTAQKLEFLNTVECSDPGIALLHIHLLLKSGSKEEARTLLFEALEIFPDNRSLIELFGYFLSQNLKREELVSVFGQYIPQFRLNPEVPVFSLEAGSSPLINEPQDETEPDISTDEFREIQVQFHSGEVDAAYEKLLNLLKLNPFDAEYYQLMAEIYAKKKDRHQAELHTLASEFLSKE